MCDSKCGGGSCGACIPALIGKILLIVGGINWGLVGVGMLMGNDWNVVHMLLESVPKVEAVVYVLVGVAAIVKIFGCRCKKCMGGCGSCSGGACDTSGMDKKV